jgi:trk system potassium uptake protein TrkA
MKFCVIGLGRFGYHLIVSLSDQGNEVLAIDKNETIIESLRDYVTQAICAEIRDEDTLLAVGIEAIDTVIVAIGDDFAQATLITALLKKKIKVPKGIARAVNEIHETILRLVGADKVLSLEKDMAIKTAHKLSMPVGELVHITDDFATNQIRISNKHVGKTVNEIVNPKSHRVTCIAVKKGENLILISPEYIVLENDVLVFAGSRKALSALIHL